MAKTSMKIKQQRTQKYSTRAYNRCKICGRPHGYLRKFGICRICFRNLSYSGQIPGVKKASWYVVADMLTRIRNANSAKHEKVNVPCSNMKKAIADILVEEGFIKSYEVSETDNKQGMITITLKYGEGKTRTIEGLRRVSKPGLRIYASCKDIPKVRNGLGIAIISTSKGLMTDKKARKENIGGEVLAFVW